MIHHSARISHCCRLLVLPPRVPQYGCRTTYLSLGAARHWPYCQRLRDSAHRSSRQSACEKLYTCVVSYCFVLVGAKLAAVASNHTGRLATTGAEAFAEAHNIPSVFDSYSDLAASEDIDICYISSLNPAHKDDAIGCLKQGKHGAIPLRWALVSTGADAVVLGAVVVEKPMAMGRDDAAEMIAAAQANNVFFMEGMWTRFFPAIRHARQLIRAGAIGEVVHAMADFGFECTDGPDSRMFDRSLGGGGLLDIGCYTIDAATIAFENRPLTAVLAQGAPIRIMGLPALQPRSRFTHKTKIAVQICQVKSVRRALTTQAIWYYRTAQAAPALGRVRHRYFTRYEPTL